MFRTIKIAAAVAMLVAVSACGRSLNAVSAAGGDLALKGDALYGTYVNVKREAVTLAEAPGTSASTKQTLAHADSVVKPVMDALMIAVQEYDRARVRLREGASIEAIGDIAVRLKGRLAEAEKALTSFQSAVKTLRQHETSPTTSTQRPGRLEVFA